MGAMSKQLQAACDFETWLSGRLGVDLFEGDTTAAQRREQARKLILRRGVEHEMIGVNGARKSVGEKFAQVYGQGLHASQATHENGDGV